MPDATWPNLPNYSEFSPEDHAAHTTPRGIQIADDRKTTKQLMKVARKPHLKMTAKRSPVRRRKKR